MRKSNELGVRNFTIAYDFFLNARPSNAHGINAKEREIMELVARGLSNKEIAGELFLGEGTVRNYLSTLLEKLALRDRTQLAVYYYTEVRKA